MAGKLMFTRCIGESIMVGDDVKVTISGIKGSHIKIKTYAPKSISIHRKEIYQRIKENGLQDKSNEKVVIEIND